MRLGAEGYRFTAHRFVTDPLSHPWRIEFTKTTGETLMSIEVKSDAARQGIELGTMRYVLATSLAFTVTAMATLLFLA